VKKNNIFLVFSLLAGLALIFTACANPVFSFDDNAVKFDSSGHVKENVVYTYYSSSTENTTSYSTDGTYEQVEKSWDTASSSWMQSFGMKGTYSYATATKMMTININAMLSGIGGSYVNFAASDPFASMEPKSLVSPMILGTHNSYDAATGSNGAYTYTQTMTYWDDSSSEMTGDITMATDMSSYTTMSTEIGYNASHTAIGGSRDQYVYTVSAIFPSGITSISKAKGKTITLNSETHSHTPYTWTSGTTFTAGTAVTVHSAETMTASVSSDAKYVAMPQNFSLARKINF
jgi:hypothetical protein